MRRAALAISVTLPLWGCSSMSDVVDGRRSGDGTGVVYPIPAHVAYAASRDALRAAGADAIEEHPEGWYMLATVSATLFSYGGYIGVFLERVDDVHTRVVAVSRRRMSTNIVPAISESELHEQLARRIALIATQVRADAQRTAPPPELPRPQPPAEPPAPSLDLPPPPPPPVP